MRQLVLIVMTFSLAGLWCAAGTGTPARVFPINEASLAQMRKEHPLASAEVDVPVPFPLAMGRQGLMAIEMSTHREVNRGSRCGDAQEAGRRVSMNVAAFMERRVWPCTL